MEWFEQILSGRFKKTEAGEIVFFPWGPWRKGYILKNAAQKRTLANSMGFFQLFGLGAMMVSLQYYEPTKKPLFFALSLAAYYLIYYLGVKAFTRGMESSKLNLTFREMRKTTDASSSIGMLTFRACCAFVVFLSGLGLLYFHADKISVFFGCGVIAISGYALFQFAGQIKEKKRM
jgi:uncharacterized membrane protein YesL